MERLCTKVADDVKELGIQLEVEKCLRWMIDSIVDETKESAELWMENALRRTLQQLDDTRRELKKQREAQRKNDIMKVAARDLFSELKSEYKTMNKFMHHHESLNNQLALYKSKLSEMSNSLDKTTNELAESNAKCKTLEAKIDALVTVQEHSKRQNYYLHGIQRQSTTSSVGVVTPVESSSVTLLVIIQEEKALKIIESFLTKLDQNKLKLLSKSFYRHLQIRAWTCPLCDKLVDRVLDICPQCNYNMNERSSDPAEVAHSSLSGARDTLQPGVLGRWLTPFRNEQKKTESARRSPFDGLSVEQLRLIVAFDERFQSHKKALEYKNAMIEDLNAKLTTYTNTKNILVQKLQESEKVLKHTMEQRDQARAQIASDKEVIAFLDLRLNEMEMQAKRHSMTPSPEAHEPYAKQSPTKEQSEIERLRYQVAALQEENKILTRQSKTPRTPTTR